MSRDLPLRILADEACASRSRTDRVQNRPRLAGMRTIAAIVALVGAALICAPTEVESAGGGDTGGGSLLGVASKQFPDLTRAERALLVFADKSNQADGEYAIAGSSSTPLDPSNDPSHADEWPPDRNIRAELFRWLAVDNIASTLVDPNGVRVLGAIILGKIDLSFTRVSFVLTLVRCWIPGEINLVSADLPALDLRGSRTGRINGRHLTVHGDLNLAALYNPQGGEQHGAFSASEVVDLINAKIGGEADFKGGRFHYSETGAAPWEKIQKIAINLTGAEVDGDVTACCGFESQGCTFLAETTIGGDLSASAGASLTQTTWHSPGPAMISRDMSFWPRILDLFQQVSDSNRTGWSRSRTPGWQPRLP